jgi:hypothetical protein
MLGVSTIVIDLLFLKDELSDYENMVDEAQLEPDYYIDRPVSLGLFKQNIAFSNFRS